MSYSIYIINMLFYISVLFYRILVSLDKHLSSNYNYLITFSDSRFRYDKLI